MNEKSEPENECHVIFDSRISLKPPECLIKIIVDSSISIRGKAKKCGTGARYQPVFPDLSYQVDNIDGFIFYSFLTTKELDKFCISNG